MFIKKEVFITQLRAKEISIPRNSLYFGIIHLLVIFLIGCGGEEVAQTSDELPKAAFSFSIDRGQVTFTNESQNANEFKWDFGDGNISSSKDPVHVYLSAGTYEITLTALNGSESHEMTESVTLNAPVADFEFAIDEATITFTNLSQHVDTFVWDFGDGNTSSEKNPVHSYINDGEYTVELTAIGLLPNGIISKKVEITSISNSNLVGLNWVELTVSGDIWSPRNKPILTIHNDELWLLGGNTDNSRVLEDDEEIWKTVDGRNWQLVAKSNPLLSIDNWEAKAVSFNNELWLFGSSIGEHTKDGINWNHAGFFNFLQGRLDFSLTVFHNKMWIIGGRKSNNLLNDIWTSSDGKDWSQVTPSSSIFNPISGHNTIVFDNKLWVITSNEVWNTQDGVVWEQLETNSFHIGYHEAVVLNDRIYLVSRDDETPSIDNNFFGSFINKVWSSDDGINWVNLNDNPDFPDRRWFGLIGFSNKLWVMAGETGSQASGDNVNDIWSSEE